MMKNVFNYCFKNCFLNNKRKFTLKCNVSTWSPLATAFNSRPGRKFNINLTKDGTGLFRIRELASHEGFHLLKQNAIARADELVAESCSANRSRKMVSIFDDLSDSLCRVADLAEFIRIAHPRGVFAHAAEDACLTISSVVEKLNVNKSLYQSLRNVVESGDKMATTEVDQHVAKLFMFDFELCGIHLPEDERLKVVQLNDRILHLGQRFMAGAVSPRAVPLDLVPKSIRNLFIMEGDKVLVNGLYADSPDEVARQAAYKIYLYPDEHQNILISEMLQARYQLATICGFPTFAHRALKSSIVEEPEVVSEFLDTLSDQLRPRAEVDFSRMSQMKLETNPHNGPLAAWDIPYLTNRAKREWLQASSQEFSPYFSLGGCMEGLNVLFQSLYGITLQSDEAEVGELWSPDVYKVAVIHETEGLLGHIYCDFYERANKPNQDCHFTIQGGRLLDDGSYQNPIVVLMLNLPTPRWSGPSLLTPAMVDNLFHEMGHAMHSMLARTQYQHVTGTRCSTDLAEVPSILMEYFASDPRVNFGNKSKINLNLLSTVAIEKGQDIVAANIRKVVRNFARHYMTKEPMPEEMLQRLCASKRLFAASEMQVQVFYSVLDQRYHGKHPLSGSTTDILADVQAKYFGIPYVQNTAWQLRFSHLVGYGAKYYSYLLSRAVASWIWQSCFSADPLNRAQGERYRYHCLAHGGGKPAHALVADFLQREVTPSTLAQALVQDLELQKIHL